MKNSVKVMAVVLALMVVFMSAATGAVYAYFGDKIIFALMVAATATCAAGAMFSIKAARERVN